MRTLRPLPEILLALAGLATTGAFADFDERVTLSADTLTLRNLAGRIEVQGHSGSSFEIELHVTGKDATRERVSVETREGREATVSVRFPLEESTRYVCPHVEGKTSFNVEQGSWLAQLLGGGSVHVSNSGSGLAICADATVRVPRGKSLVVEHGAGPLSAKGVGGDLSLSSHSGSVEVRDVEGSVSVDTGSGEVRVSGIGGDTLIDTGSGDVQVSGAGGKLSVDTGSGEVEVADFDGSKLFVDTGSGSVKAEGIGADDVSIDTGSGAVSLLLDRMGAGRFEVDTGSGSIEVRIPPGASAAGHADTGSGGVAIDLADARIERQDDGEVDFTVGSGGARLHLDSGSGSIKVHH